MKHYIDPNLWHVCKICNETIQNLAKKYGGSNKYYTQVFLEHLREDHQINITWYLIQYCSQIMPKCQCGICNQNSIIRYRGAKFYWKEFICGRYPGTLRWAEKAKIDRCGKNNPMYNATPWNKGKNKYTSNSVNEVSKKLSGRKISQESKQKMSVSAKKRLIHGHTGKHHSIETKNFLRQNTLRLIKLGIFKQTKTKPFLKFKELLLKNNIKFEEEKISDCWCFDFYLPDYNILIEVDGDYFHSNPIRWKNGPISKTQKINHHRDIKKNEYCIKNNFMLIRFWEHDILNNINAVEQILLCKLKPLLE
jgi:very-short-patch-repair endonuclease